MPGKEDMDKKTTVFAKGYETVRKLKESDMFLIKSKDDGKTYMMKEYVLNTEKAATKCCKELKDKLSRHGCHAGHNQALIDYSCKVDSGFCSTTYIVNAYYQYVCEDLARDANAHDGVAVHERLTNGLYGGLTGLAELNELSENYNDIRPEFVGFNSCGQGLLRTRSDKYGKTCREIAMNTVSKSNYFQYCSPEVYNSVVKKGSKDISEQKNDVFALGMSVLEAGIKGTVQACYVPSGFNEAELRKCQEEFVHDHGCANTLLCDMVELCTTVCPLDRHTATELLSKVPSYCEIIAHYNNEIGRESHVTVSTNNTEVCVEQKRPVAVHTNSHTHSNVVHREPVHQTSHVHHAQPSHSTGNTVRREPMVTQGHSHVSRVEPSHHSQPSHHGQHSRVVHQEPVHSHGNVVRRVDGHHGQPSRVVHQEPVHSHGNVVNRVEHENTGVYRSQACNVEVPKETVTTRRITDPEEIAKIKARMAKNAPQKVTEEVHHEEVHHEAVVESHTPEYVEEPHYVAEPEHEEVAQLEEDVHRVDLDQQDIHED